MTREQSPDYTVVKVTQCDPGDDRRLLIVKTKRADVPLASAKTQMAEYLETVGRDSDGGLKWMLIIGRDAILMSLPLDGPIRYSPLHETRLRAIPSMTFSKRLQLTIGSQVVS